MKYPYPKTLKLLFKYYVLNPLRFKRHERKNKNRRISYYDTGNNSGLSDNWIKDFIEKRVSRSEAFAPIDIFYQYGPVEDVKTSRARNKIVVITENNHVPLSRWWWYRLIHNEPDVSLVVGFDYIDFHKYCRFPFWLFRNFAPDVTYDDVAAYVEKYNKPQGLERDKFCSFICRYDYFGDRAFFADAIESLGQINYPSGFRHNDDDLRDKFNDDKTAYLSQFKFNLCPENSNDRGYVTEKIFDAIRSGCIPIYWGNESCGSPEPGILNPDAIIFLNRDGDNAESLALIKRLMESPEEYRRFASQPRFVPGAADVIYAFFEDLKNKIKLNMY